jgi:transketolase
MGLRTAPRDILGSVLVELGERSPDLIVLDADFCTASKITAFRDRFPDRFIEVGIAEQNMMGIAAGLSTMGFTSFVSTICTFCSRRACDQVTTSIALPGMNVKIIGVYAGLFVGKNGSSHQSLEDIAIMRSIANMKVLQPVDAEEARQILHFAARTPGPMYIRIGRDPVPRFVPDGYQFEMGKSLILREGRDLTMMAYGDLMENTMEAALRLESRGIQARVVNMSSLKPLDEMAVIKAAQDTGRILTIDNHNIIGGLGSAVSEIIAEKAPARIRRVGIRDVFGKSGTNPQMMEKFGLRAEDIEREALFLLQTSA